MPAWHAETFSVRQIRGPSGGVLGVVTPHVRAGRPRLDLVGPRTAARRSAFVEQRRAHDVGCGHTDKLDGTVRPANQRRKASSASDTELHHGSRCADRRPAMPRPHRENRGTPRGGVRAPRWSSRKVASVSSSRCLANHSVTSRGMRICSCPGSSRIQRGERGPPGGGDAEGTAVAAARLAGAHEAARLERFSSRYTWLDVTFQNRASPRRASSSRSQPVAGPSCRNPSRKAWVAFSSIVRSRPLDIPFGRVSLESQHSPREGPTGWVLGDAGGRRLLRRRRRHRWSDDRRNPRRAPPRPVRRDAVRTRRLRRAPDPARLRAVRQDARDRRGRRSTRWCSACSTVCSARYQLSAPTGIEIGPGESAQPSAPRRRDLSGATRPHGELVVNVMWPLDDFTEANGDDACRARAATVGATTLPTARCRDPLAIEMPAGSALIYLGSLWHGGGANRHRRAAARRRVALRASDGCGRSRTTCSSYRPPSPATLPERLQELLGLQHPAAVHRLRRRPAPEAIRTRRRLLCDAPASSQCHGSS